MRLIDVTLTIIILSGIIVSVYGVWLALIESKRNEVFRDYINNLESVERQNIKLL